jgi:hypothetical protein
MFTFNPIIKYAIAYRRPLSFGKLGVTEAVHLNRRTSGVERWWRGHGDPKDVSLMVNSGLYLLGPETAERWARIYTVALNDLDFVTQWQPGGDDIEPIARYASNAIVAPSEDLLPLSLGKDSWHYALQGKRVLVVHPMAETIHHQIPVFSKLWPGAGIGPVRVIKTPWSPAVDPKLPRKHASWFAALEWMEEQVIWGGPFDVAILGCGSYALPLAQFIKRHVGVPCIHVAGKLQLLFGILGKRWDNQGVDWRPANFYNNSEYWIRPLAADRPFGAHLMDHGCYW